MIAEPSVEAGAPLFAGREVYYITPKAYNKVSNDNGGIASMNLPDTPNTIQVVPVGK